MSRYLYLVQITIRALRLKKIFLEDLLINRAPDQTSQGDCKQAKYQTTTPGIGFWQLLSLTAHTGSLFSLSRHNPFRSRSLQ